MPQLKTAIWMFLLLTTWFAYMTIIFPKTMNYCTTCDPMAIALGMEEFGPWLWWWE
uniref:ATP synthase F0 subunit 8 n=1 Tax=Odontamblyopus rebecca TaxID=714203 RepID=A0A191QQC6_9GOBI|nr:ATP synthase F0 subunit 8 [Odontamblyopus rebecca]ANB32200.1 ATP synthase F0 subunit 8 [Odontamblyopus rebecca]